MLNTKYWAQPLLPLWNLHHWCSFTVSMMLFFIWTHEKDKLELFLIALTIITWKLNLPYSLIKKAFFLELKIFLRTIQPLTLTLSLQTGIFLLCIWTSRSYQTLHLFKSTLRNNRICSYKKDLEIHLDNMILWFSARCYPKTLFMKR